MQKRDRLRSGVDFQRVLAAGRLYAGRTLIGFAAASSGDRGRVGITVSRQIRGSVRRNRAKRRLREVARVQLLGDDSRLRVEGINYDVVLIARPSALDAPFADLLADGDALRRRLRRTRSGDPRVAP